MPLASILLAVVAFGCAAVGFVTTLIPVVGAVFSFAGPTLALLGVVLGGVAMSRRKRSGQPTDVARAGVILSVVAFVPSLLVAMFCGVCNAMVSSGQMHVQRNMRYSVGQPLAPMGGMGAAGANAMPPPGAVVGAPAPAAPPGAPSAAPAMPPPPLPAGPRRDQAHSAPAPAPQPQPEPGH